MIESLRARINALLKDWYETDRRSDLDEACWFMLDTTGRRWRPLILCAAAQDCNVLDDALLHVAACFEMLHCASLALDDLPCMDNADVRRGQLSCHRRFGEDVTILATLDLVSAAVSDIFEYERHTLKRPHPSIKTLLSRREILFGQFLDLHGKENGTPEERAYLKNGVTFEKMLGILDDLRGETAPGKPLAAWGVRIGSWHQAMDDLFDGRGDPALGGKPVGVDRAPLPDRELMDRAEALEREIRENAPGEASRAVIDALVADKWRAIEGK